MDSQQPQPVPQPYPQPHPVPQPQPQPMPQPVPAPVPVNQGLADYWWDKATRTLTPLILAYIASRGVSGDGGGVEPKPKPAPVVQPVVNVATKDDVKEVRADIDELRQLVEDRFDALKDSLKAKR